MSLIITVDANIILSALLGGKPSSILFDARFDFTTTEFTINEVYKYMPRLSKKLDLSQIFLEEMLGNIPLTAHRRPYYRDSLRMARKIIGEIDEKDVDILALAIKLDAYLWSQDRDFDKCGYSKLLKTYNFIE